MVDAPRGPSPRVDGVEGGEQSGERRKESCKLRLGRHDLLDERQGDFIRYDRERKTETFTTR